MPDETSVALPPVRWRRRDLVAFAAALIGPPIVALAISPLRDDVDHTNAALVLVLVVVAVAATGSRWAGALAAAMSALSLDFFFTTPYFRLTIDNGDDLETVLLLVLVGIAVSELALWGRAQQARASKEEGYLSGISAAVEAGASGATSASELIGDVCRQLEVLLDLEAARFDYSTGLGHPRLHRDGHLSWRRATWDVATNGLPTEVPAELLVQTGGWFRGRFLLSAKPGTRPTREQIAVATALADSVGAALSASDPRRA